MLVFVQHGYKQDLQKAQMATFQGIIAGDGAGLRLTSFRNAEVATIRQLWRRAGMPTQ